MSFYQKRYRIKKHCPLWASYFAKALWSADCWLNLLTKSGMFLTELEEQNRLALGKLCTTSYAALASKAVQEKRFLFRLRPKYHLWHHLAIDVRSSKLNCNIHATWMDEDSTRQVHRRTASENVLRRFLLGLRANLDRGLALVRSSQEKKWRWSALRACAAHQFICLFH